MRRGARADSAAFKHKDAFRTKSGKIMGYEAPITPAPITTKS